MNVHVPSMVWTGGMHERDPHPGGLAGPSGAARGRPLRVLPEPVRFNAPERLLVRQALRWAGCWD